VRTSAIAASCLSSLVIFLTSGMVASSVPDTATRFVTRHAGQWFVYRMGKPPAHPDDLPTPRSTLRSRYAGARRAAITSGVLGRMEGR
jgi:hypothetical protein